MRFACMLSADHRRALDLLDARLLLEGGVVASNASRGPAFEVSINSGRLDFMVLAGVAYGTIGSYLR